jgi:hypothetical protein
MAQVCLRLPPTRQQSFLTIACSLVSSLLLPRVAPFRRGNKGTLNATYGWIMDLLTMQSALLVEGIRRRTFGLDAGDMQQLPEAI